MPIGMCGKTAGRPADAENAHRVRGRREDVDPYGAERHGQRARAQPSLVIHRASDIQTLLPILRSQQEGEILALLLGDPDLELSLTEIAARTGAPTRGSTARPAGRAGWPGHRGRSGARGSSEPTSPARTMAG